MATKKPAAPPAPTPTPQHVTGAAITHNVITVHNNANKHTRAAVVALALAVEANARALSDIAAALKGKETGPLISLSDIRGL